MFSFQTHSYTRSDVSAQLKFVKRSFFALLILSGALFGFTSAQAQTNTISGNLVLPASIGNAVGDYHFSVIARVANGSGSQVSAVGSETIFNGTNSVSFTIPVPSDPDTGNANEKWRIDYVCNVVPSTNDCNGVAQSGSYDGANSAALNSNALLLDVGTDHIGLNFPVLKADTITGTVSLPGDLVAPAGGINLTIRTVDSGGTNPVPDTVTIPQGASNVNYQLNIATNASATRTVDYECDSNCNGLFARGFYVSNTEMSTQFGDAAQLSGGVDQTNINLVIIPTNVISGTLSLPSPFSAPSSGTQFSITALPVGLIGGFSSDVVTIPNGMTSIPYSIDIVGNAGGVWRVNYSCQSNCNGLVTNGFFNSVMTTLDFDLGTDLAAAQDHIEIDIEVLDFKSISGAISLPFGNANGDIALSVFALTDDFLVNSLDEIVIVDGTSSQTFQMDVPKQANDVTLGVTCTSNCSNLTETVYYNSSGTVTNVEASEGLAGTTNHSDADIALLQPSALLGTIGLPIGATATDVINLRVIASLDDASQTSFVDVSIAQNTNNIAFEVPVAPQTGRHWLLRYECLNACSGFVNTAYFTDVGTVPDADNGRQFGGDRQDNLDFDLLPGDPITGTLSLPNDLLAELGGTEVRLVATDDSGNEPTQAVNVVIGQSDNDTLYRIDVPTNSLSRWLLTYQCLNGCDPVLDFGYFAESGTTGDIDQATLLLGNAFPQTGKNIVMRPAFAINGSLTLANGAQAPSGGMNFIVRAVDVANEAVFFSSSATIEATGTTTSYTLQTDTDSATALRITYFCTVNCTGFSSGFYSAGGTVVIPADATLIAGGVEQNGIDMTVLESNSISGTLALPTGVLAGAAGFTVSVDALDSVNGGSAGNTITIPTSQNSVPYVIEVRPDTSAQWQVRYSCFGQSVCEGFLDSAFFSSAGMVFSQGLATSFAGAQNHTNVDLSIVSANTFSGEISLPEDDIAPSGGVEVSLRATDTTNSQPSDSISVVIPEGANSIAFALDVPTNPTSTWVIEYDCRSQCDGLFDQGFYNASATVATRAAASSLSGGTSQSNIGLELLRKIEFSGSLSLPELVNAANDIALLVSAIEVNSPFSASSEIEISTGTNNTAYTLEIPAIIGTQYALQYDCISGCGDFATDGFYNENVGSVLTQAEATEIAVVSAISISGLDFSLIGRNSISGTITMAGGAVAPGDVALTVTLSDNNSNAELTQEVIILDSVSNTSFDFSPPAAVGPEWVLSYDCTNNCATLVDSGFYNTAGSVQAAMEATRLAGGQDHTGLVFDIIAKREISGTLSLPSVALNAVDFRVQLTRADNSFAESQAVTILAGQTSIPFSFLQIPNSASEWVLSYSCTSNCIGLASGFYNASSTTAIPASASRIDGTTSLNNLNMTVLNSLLVEGTINLPQGDAAGVNGITFVVVGLDLVNNGLRSVSESITIASGQSSVGYILNLPNVPTANWVVQYACVSNCFDDYSDSGFYAGVGVTRAFIAGAQPFNVASNITGIDIAVLRKLKISGRLELLSGRTAPPEGMEFQVGAFDINGGSGNDEIDKIVNLDAGERSINYQLDLPADPMSEWRIRYFCIVGCADSLIVGYYSSSATTADINAATLLPSTTNHSNIDLLVLDEDAEFNNDDDGDGVENSVDNCRFAPNPDQIDSNNDDIGDACEAEDDGFCFTLVISSSKLAMICL